MGVRSFSALVSAGLLLSGLSGPAVAEPVVSDARVIAARAGDLAVSPSPAVHLDTDGSLFGLAGIRIDDPNADQPDSTFQGQFFAAQAPSWLSVVVLDRKTLSKVYAKDYTCPQVVGQSRYDAGEKAAAPCIDAVQKDFISHKLDEKDLVIATNFGHYGNNQAPYGVIKALKPIGVQPVWWWDAAATLTPGTFSAVGVPGAKPGQAFQAAGNSGTPDEAAIRTLLTRNNRGLYEVMPSDRVEFVTDARASDSATHVMRINGKRVAQAVDGGGYHVAWLNRGAGSPDQLNVQDEFFATQTQGRSEILRMRDRINDIAGTESLGFVVSLGQPLPKNPDYATSLAVDDLVDSLQWLGATRNGAYGPLDLKTARGQSYTLIGFGDGPGVESTHYTKPPGLGTPKKSGKCKAAKRKAEKKARKFGADSPKAKKAKKRAAKRCRRSATQGDGRGQLPRALREGENNAGVAGILGRDELWRYIPTITLDGDSDPDLPPVSVLYAEPSDWPDADDPGRQAAIADIGRAAGLGRDPRGQYWTQAYSNEYWSNRLEDVRDVKYRADDYSRKDFTAAQDQLVQEIKWVKETYGYYAKLARPYESAGLQTWAKMTAVADSIDRSVDVPNSTKVTGNIMTITRAAAELVGEFPGVGEAVSLGMATFDLAAEIAEVAAGEGLDEEYRVAVSELGQRTADRLDEATATVGTTFPRIVVSDYRKLKRVGQCAGSAQACPDRKDWQLTPEGLKQTGEQFQDSMSVMFYQSLLPAKYRAFRLDASPRKQANSAICAVNLKDVVNGFKPWKDASPRVSTPVRLYASHNAGDTGLYNVLALGATKNDMQLYNELTYPSASSLEPLFGTGKQQLGVDPEAFIERSWDSYVPGSKYACVWDKNFASGRRDVLTAPAVKEGLGHGLFKDVKVRLVNDTGRLIWVAKYLEPGDQRNWNRVEPGGHFDADSDSWTPTMVRLGVMFNDPARTDQAWQDELQIVNPPAETPFVWHERTDAWSHKWPVDEKSARGQTGWKDYSYQSNGYPYNLFMKRDEDTPYYKWFTLAYSLRSSTPLSPPGLPWG